jgi:hypothetical protein
MLTATTPDFKPYAIGAKIGSGTNEVRRKTADGKTAIFDAKTKQFLRYAQ